MLQELSIYYTNVTSKYFYYRATSLDEVISILFDNKFRFSNTKIWKTDDPNETFFDNWPLDKRYIQTIVDKSVKRSENSKFKHLIPAEINKNHELLSFLNPMFHLIGRKYSYCVTPTLSNKYKEKYFEEYSKNVLVEFNYDFAEKFSLLGKNASRPLYDTDYKQFEFYRMNYINNFETVLSEFHDLMDTNSSITNHLLDEGQYLKHSDYKYENEFRVNLLHKFKEVENIINKEKDKFYISLQKDENIAETTSLQFNTIKNKFEENIIDKVHIIV